MLTEKKKEERSAFNYQYSISFTHENEQIVTGCFHFIGVDTGHRCLYMEKEIS